jgi:hypothetical protein
MTQPALRRGYSRDADKASFAFGALAGATTEATAVLQLTLTKNARRFHAVGIGTDQPVLFARRRKEATGNPVFFGSVGPSGVFEYDLGADGNGWHDGDLIYAFAPTALAAGSVWVAAT